MSSSYIIAFLHGLLLGTDLNKATICRTILCRSNATFTSVHIIMPQVCICHIYSKCEIPQWLVSNIAFNGTKQLLNPCMYVHGLTKFNV